MSTSIEMRDAVALVERRFSESSIAAELEVKNYPGETLILAYVTPAEFGESVTVGNAADEELHRVGFEGVVVVRASRPHRRSAAITAPRKADVRGDLALRLAQLLTEKARATEVQPSLSYIPDTANNLATILTSRHHLIFGRRGAGKTALMVEAKQALEREAASTVWLNIQTLRREGPERIFLWVAKDICGVLLRGLASKDQGLSRQSVERLHADIEGGLTGTGSDVTTYQMVPRLQRVLREYSRDTSSRMVVFIDDLYSLDRKQQPLLLDLLHGAVRDCKVWLKIATIKHLSRWFEPAPPTGLQTGDDADHVDLDVTLEQPKKAKAFLEKILESYARHVGLDRVSRIFAGEALDRLVLASGAVPRDYLVLAAQTIHEARKRPKAQQVRVQDVNRAAGSKATVKLTELEEDAVSLEQSTKAVRDALQAIRGFCIDDKEYAFFRVDFRDKERYVAEYGLLQSLMDLRLLHLVNASLSHQHEVGRRFEVFMLDLSQFTSQRFKRHLNVLDFVKGDIVLKRTGTAKPSKASSRLVDILRLGPVFPLGRLSLATDVQQRVEAAE